MSRIIVKQLPKNITEQSIRELFGGKGSITDIQLKYAPNGKFRQFCFIGYQSEEEAQKAIDFFNNSFIQTSRVKVELCSTLGAEDKPRSWSKYAKTDNKPLTNEVSYTSNDTKAKKVSKLDEILGKHKDDPEFQEFIKTYDKGRVLWANDIDVNKTNIEAAESCTKEADIDMENKVEDSENENNLELKLAEEPISDMDYMKSLMGNSKNNKTKKAEKNKDFKSDLFTVKMYNIPYKTKRQDILNFFKPIKPFSVRLPTNARGFCYVGFKSEKDMKRAMLKNNSFIKGKQVLISDFTERNKISAKLIESNEKTENAKKCRNPKWIKQEESIHNEENISESGIIFFRNLAYTVTENDLQKIFEPFGPIAEINLPLDLITRQIKGFGTVTFVMPEHAVRAFNQLDGTIFHGRLFHLIPGKSRDSCEALNDDDINNKNSSFKQKKALQLKKNASNAISWNSLFLGPNVVADILAKKFDTTKEKILGTSDGGSSAAMRLALGETQIVMEMKKFLEENGVYLNAFDDPTKAKRSKTVVLAKNLPANTTVAELAPIFSKFGPIGRIVLPPSGVTALIEFCDSSEARLAFKNLAFSKFKHLPLYLEWAPENVFITSIDGKAIIPKQDTIPKQELTIEKEIGTEETEIEIANDTNDTNDEPETNTTLFLRNLNTETAKETIIKHFERLGTVHSVDIVQKKDASNPKRVVSLGYGFIQFKTRSATEKALKEMQFTNIDGKEIELKRSDRILKSEHKRKTSNITKQTSSKILVRNIPFQASKKEVYDLFKAFGELRSVRLPLKMVPGENTHRGFGFVDFMSKNDAKSAFQALSQSTHLYGRRLVLDWAMTDDDGNVEELRKRTTEQFKANRQSEKRSKRSVFDAGSSIGTETGALEYGNDSDT